jgi:O-antigen/teichoic acid export membrane protein
MLKKLIERIDASLSRHGNLGAMLIKGVFGTAGIRVGHAAIGFVTAIVLAKMLGPSGYGTYAFVMAVVAFIAMPTELGIPGLAVREIAVTNAHKDWSQMRGFIVRAHQTNAVLCVVILAMATVALLIWGDRLDVEKRTCMWLGLLIVPLLSLGSLRGAMLRGLRKVVLGQLPEQIIRPLTLLTLILLLPLFGTKLATPVGIMSVQIISVATAFLCGVAFFLRNRPSELAGAEPHFRSGSLLTASIPFGLSAAMQLINGRTDILVLGIFREDADVGIYRVAVQIAAVMVFAIRAVNANQAPHIAHLYVKGDMQKLQKMITTSSQGMALYALLILLAILFFGESIIRTFFGAQFVTAYVPLVILAVGQLVNVSMGSVASLLNMTGHERDTTRIVVIGAIVNVVLNFSLTPLWGMTGAAVATASGLVTWNLIMRRQVRKRIGIEPSPLFRYLLRRKP